MCEQNAGRKPAATGTATFSAASTFAYEVDSTDPLSLSAAADLLVAIGMGLAAHRAIRRRRLLY